MGTDSRLTATGKVKDRYGNRSGAIGVGRTDKNISFIEGVWFPGTEDAPTFPEWADGKKIVQAAIWRVMGLQDDPGVTEEFTGTIDRSGLTTHALTSVDLYPNADGLFVREFRWTPVVGDVNSGAIGYSQSGGLAPAVDDVVWTWFDQSMTEMLLPTDLTLGFGAEVVRKFGPEDVPAGWLNDSTLRQYAKRFMTEEEVTAALRSARITSSRRMFRIFVYAGRHITYKIRCGPLNLPTPSELNASVAMITDDGYPLLYDQNGSIPLRGGDVFTIGYKASTMPAIAGGANLFACALGQGVNPGISYCFVVK